MPESEPLRLDEVKASLRLVNLERSPDPAADVATPSAVRGPVVRTRLAA